jgi:hypothetical protein
METVKNEKQSDTKQCPNCAIANPRDAAFCGACGTRLPEPAKIECRQPEPDKKNRVAAILATIAILTVVAIAGFAAYLTFSENPTGNPGTNPKPPGTENILIEDPPGPAVEWRKAHSKKNLPDPAKIDKRQTKPNKKNHAVAILTTIAILTVVAVAGFAAYLTHSKNT